MKNPPKVYDPSVGAEGKVFDASIINYATERVTYIDDESGDSVERDMSKVLLLKCTEKKDINRNLVFEGHKVDVIAKYPAWSKKIKRCTEDGMLIVDYRDQFVCFTPSFVILNYGADIRIKSFDLKFLKKKFNEKRK